MTTEHPHQRRKRFDKACASPNVLRFPPDPTACRLRLKASAANCADPILALEQQLWAADEAWSAVSDAPGASAAYERFRPLDEKMRDAVPISLEGLAAKLRYLKWHVGIASDDIAQTAARTALEGLEALIEGRQS